MTIHDLKLKENYCLFLKGEEQFGFITAEFIGVFDKGKFRFFTEEEIVLHIVDSSDTITIPPGNFVVEAKYISAVFPKTGFYEGLLNEI